MMMHPADVQRLTIVEDEVRRIVDAMPEEVLAILALYVHALGMSCDRARAVKRIAFHE
jgi:hypothetical protein